MNARLKVWCFDTGHPVRSVIHNVIHNVSLTTVVLGVLYHRFVPLSLIHKNRGSTIRWYVIDISCSPFMIHTYTIIKGRSFTYDHRLKKTGHPVRSAIHKLEIG